MTNEPKTFPVATASCLFFAALYCIAKFGNAEPNAIIVIAAMNEGTLYMSDKTKDENTNQRVDNNKAVNAIMNVNASLQNLVRGMSFFNFPKEPSAFQIYFK